MSIATKCTCHMSPNGFCNSSVKQCTKLIKMVEKKYVPCGGCGATHPSQICIGCQHLFPLEDEPHYKIHSAAIIGHGKPEINHDRVISNQVAGMSLEEAIFQDGYSAGVEFEKKRSKTGPVWVKASDRLPLHKAFWNMPGEHNNNECYFPVRIDGHKYRVAEIFDERQAGAPDPIYMFVINGDDYYEKDFHRIEWLDESAPSGEREGDAVAFHDWVLKNEYVIDNRAEYTHSTQQLYDIFKQQNGNNENS